MEGLIHFHFLLNIVIDDVNLATVDDSILSMLFFSTKDTGNLKPATGPTGPSQHALSYQKHWTGPLPP